MHRPLARRQFRLVPQAAIARGCCTGHDAAPPRHKGGGRGTAVPPLHKQKHAVVPSRCAENPIAAPAGPCRGEHSNTLRIAAVTSQDSPRATEGFLLSQRLLRSEPK